MPFRAVISKHLDSGNQLNYVKEGRKEGMEGGRETITELAMYLVCQIILIKRLSNICYRCNLQFIKKNKESNTCYRYNLWFLKRAI